MTHSFSAISVSLSFAKALYALFAILRRLFICNDSYKFGASGIPVRRVYVQTIFLVNNYFGLNLVKGSFTRPIVGNDKLDHHLGLVWSVCCCQPPKGSGERGHLSRPMWPHCNATTSTLFIWRVSDLSLSLSAAHAFSNLHTGTGPRPIRGEVPPFTICDLFKPRYWPNMCLLLNQR